MTKTLIDNNECFVSWFPEANIVYSHIHEKTMVIETVTVHSGLNNSRGYPIGSGLIFTSNNMSFFDMTNIFDDMTPEEY